MKLIVYTCVLSLAFSGFGITTGFASDISDATGVSRPAFVPSGEPKPGETITFSLSNPRGAGLHYQVATSLGPGPIVVGNHVIPVSFDAVFFMSVSGLAPEVFENYAGTFDEKGLATAKLHLPNHPGVIGLRVYNVYLSSTNGATALVEGEGVSQGVMFGIRN